MNDHQTDNTRKHLSFFTFGFFALFAFFAAAFAFNHFSAETGPSEDFSAVHNNAAHETLVGHASSHVLPVEVTNPIHTYHHAVMGEQSNPDISLTT